MKRSSSASSSSSMVMVTPCIAVSRMAAMQSSTDRKARERPIAFAATLQDGPAGGTKTMRMPKLLACVFAIVAASAASAQQPNMPPSPLPPVQIKAGISDPVNTVLAWYVARAAGLYAAQGLNVDIINMNGGSKGAEELQAGRIDVMHVGLSSVVRVNQSGGDLRAIASLSNVIRFTFFSAPGVKTAADLKGGVVGVSTFGSESDSTVTLALQKLGLTRDDVTVKEYGGGTKRLQAGKSGGSKKTAL